MAQSEKSYTPRHLRSEQVPRGRPDPKASAVRAAKKRGETARNRRAASAAGTGRAEKPSASSELFHKTLLPTVENVYRLDQVSLRVGVTWLLLLPVLLLIIRRLTGSSKITFLIIWVVGMFIISAALILIGYADHELKRFLNDVKRYEPSAADTTLDSLLSYDRAEADTMPFSPDDLLGTMQRIRKRLAGGEHPEKHRKDEMSGEDEARLLIIEQWLQRLEQHRGKEAEHAEHTANHSR